MFRFTFIGLLLIVFFAFDLLWGTIEISINDIYESLRNFREDDTISYLIWNFRLPKAITAVLAGSGISISGLMMQNLFRNPLADTSILGIGSGAGMGVAIYTMAFSLFPSLAVSTGLLDTWGLVVAAFLGALTVLLIVSAVASILDDVISVLVVGVMIGFIASSFIAILQFLSDEETLKGYLLWSFASVSGMTWKQLYVLFPVMLIGLSIVLCLPKYMNAMNLGENYTRSLGIDPKRVRFFIIIATSLLSGVITAFTGPIAFLGVAVPHFTRLIFRTADNRILIPATILLGALLMLICDLCSQVPGQMVVLPINAITSLIGAPVVIFVITRARRKLSIS